MHYAVLGFDSNASFNRDEFNIEYQGFDLTLVKEMKVEKKHGDKTYVDSVSNQLILKTSRADEYSAHEAGLLFLSELSWLYGISIYSIGHTGGTAPVKYLTKFAGHSSGRMVVNLEYYKPMDLDDSQRLALGLYKEGISNNSIFFKYLGLFKVLEIQMNGEERQQWLTEFLEDRWEGFSFEGKYDYVPRDAEDLQSFLYKYGRCAVAHANTDPTVDSHSIHDFRTIGVCYNVIKDAVEHHMKEGMGIPALLHY